MISFDLFITTVIAGQHPPRQVGNADDYSLRDILANQSTEKKCNHDDRQFMHNLSWGSNTFNDAILIYRGCPLVQLLHLK